MAIAVAAAVTQGYRAPQRLTPAWSDPADGDYLKSDKLMQAWNETNRLATPPPYHILDVSPEVAFDDFVQIAAQACDAPIAVINLTDDARQGFTAEIGVGVRQISLDASICAHLILQPGVLVVPNLTLDPRFDCHPLVTGTPEWRFYAGASLETSQGLPLGTMCVLDYKPHSEGLTGQQTFTLKALARQVVAHLELRRALQQRAEAEAAKDAMLIQMAAVAAEKELLVQQVHHRVKNSLSMVQSLLLLQARASAHQEAAQQLRESATRVRTFGLMHEHLYRVGTASLVDVSVYLHSLIAAQQSVFASILDGRVITCNAPSALWPSSEISKLGLIVVELVSNALKYGKGAVKVTLQHQDGEAVLTIEDEGELPEDFDPLRQRSLGMRIVTNLLQGQRGRLEIDRARGHTCFIATLKVFSTPVM